MDRRTHHLGRALERRTVLVLAVVMAVLGALVGVVVGSLPVVFALGGGLVGAAIGAALVLDARRHGLARLVEALDATPVDARSQARLHNLVDGLSFTIGIEAPAVHVVASPARNAVALSTEQGDAAIVVTTGLLSATGRIELEAAVAWLLARIRSGDAASATTIAALTSRWPALLRASVWTVSGREFSPAHVIEVDRDACAVTRYPPGLAGLLDLVAAGHANVPGAATATAPTWIEWPLDPVATDAGTDRSRTHPPLDERITLVRDL